MTHKGETPIITGVFFTLECLMPRKAIRWPPYWDGIQRYDLSHVYPFKFTYVLPATDKFAEQSIRIQVSFSSHTFTKQCTEDEAHGPYSTKIDPRKFDHERYELSKLLEDIVGNMGNRGCFFTEYENFFIVELPAGIPTDSEYWIFFFLERVEGNQEHHLDFVVQSAYLGQRVKVPGGIRKKKVTFRTLVTKALAGVRPKRPP
jgi:hypothetical protein